MIINTIFMTKSRFNIEHVSGSSVLVFNTLSSSFIKMDAETWQNINDIEEESKNTLMKNGFIVESNDEELRDYKYDFYASIFRDSILSFYITPTMHCNFSCFYCFEEGQKKQGKMTKSTEDKVVSFLIKNKQKPIDIIWFGGEPLIGFDVMLSISNRLKENGVKYTSSIITNGSLLSPDKIDQLEILNLSFIQISMDGAKEDQDKRRFFKGGKPSFDIIMGNIKYLLENTDIPLTIQVTVDKTNATGYDDLLSYCKEHFPTYLDSERLQVGFNNVQNRTGFDVDSNCFAPEDLTQRKKREISKCGDCNTLCDFLPHKSFACGYRTPSTLAIDAEGNIYPCLELLGDTSKAIGSLKDDTISLKEIKQCALRYDPFEDDECVKCPVLPLCGGGCPRDYEKENAKEIRCTYLKNHLAELLPHIAR